LSQQSPPRAGFLVSKERSANMSRLPSPQAGGAPQSHHPSALDDAGVIANGRAVLLQIGALNTNAAARWLQLFNAASVPADAAVPVLSIPMAAGAYVSRDFGAYGKLFPDGISWCTSSTAVTKTVGSADALVDATYVQG
jgi:hypothetical protein